MEACGQTSTHLLHWMQMAGSHWGSSRAMLRFSYLEVPVGQHPSSGIALTGIRSPWFASSLAVTCWTNCGAPAYVGGTVAVADLSGAAGIGTSCMPASAASTAAKFILTICSPFLA